MNNDELNTLISETSKILKISADDLMDKKAMVSIDGINFFMIYDSEKINLMRLILELGEIEERYKPEIYELIFSMQGMLDGGLDALFDYDSSRSCLLFRVKLPVSKNTKAEGLAFIIKSFVWQIQEWRNTILKNKLIFMSEVNVALDSLA